jgi:hypothetical protein
MGHLHHPRLEDFPTTDLLSQKGVIRGCFLVSPLASFNFDTPSYNRWFNADVLSKRVVHEWGLCLVEN